MEERYLIWPSTQFHCMFIVTLIHRWTQVNKNAVSSYYVQICTEYWGWVKEHEQRWQDIVFALQGLTVYWKRHSTHCYRKQNERNAVNENTKYDMELMSFFMVELSMYILLTPLRTTFYTLWGQKMGIILILDFQQCLSHNGLLINIHWIVNCTLIVCSWKHHRRLFCSL